MGELSTKPAPRLGGYESGYESCSCLWGKGPGRLVKRLVRELGDITGMKVLDAGAGEGKNAVWLAERGAFVTAVEVSSLAIKNAKATFGDAPRVTWLHADIRDCAFRDEGFDLVVAYGLYHCLAGPDEIRHSVRQLQAATRRGGHHVLCAFNDRAQDLSAHPDLEPCLLPHEDYESLFKDWELTIVSDEDLTESHPHNDIVHTHSLTRILARRPR